MGKSPDQFDCRVVGWNESQKLVQRATDKIIQSEFSPTAIVGIARGGWVPARTTADFLEIDNLTSIKVDHYQGTTKTEEAEIQFETRTDAIQNEDVLIVDDIVDTGQTVLQAVQNIEQKGAGSARSLTVHSLPSSEVSPDYVGESLSEFYWVVYPWNVVEDINQLTSNVLTGVQKPVTVPELQDRLNEHHNINNTDLSKLDEPYH